MSNPPLAYTALNALEKRYWQRFAELFALVNPLKPEKGIQAMLARARELSATENLPYPDALQQTFDAAKARTERRLQLLNQCSLPPKQPDKLRPE